MTEQDIEKIARRVVEIMAEKLESADWVRKDEPRQTGITPEREMELRVLAYKTVHEGSMRRKPRSAQQGGSRKDG